MLWNSLQKHAVSNCCRTGYHIFIHLFILLFLDIKVTSRGLLWSLQAELLPLECNTMKAGGLFILLIIVLSAPRECPVHSSSSGWLCRRMDCVVDGWMNGRTRMNGCQWMGWHGWIFVCISVNILKLFLAWALMLIFQLKLPHKIHDINLSAVTHSILYKNVFIFYLTFIQNYLAEIQI